MKRLLALLLTIAAIFPLCACQGNFETVNLSDPVQIPEDGVITDNTVRQIKDENTIAVFIGESGDFKYEWTVFGSNIVDVKEVNLGVQLSKTDDGSMLVALNQSEPFGFSATLAIYLNEQWTAQNATAYTNGTACAAVSLTGSDNTILNVYLDGTVSTFLILPDPSSDEITPVTEPTSPKQEEESESASAPTKAEEEKSTPAKPTESKTEAEAAPTEPKPTSPVQPVTEPTKPADNGGKDKYHTDPVPEGKPQPVEPEDQDVDKGTAYTCTFSIECSTILNNLDQLDPDKLEMVPSGGVILSTTTVTFYEGESVFDVLQRVCKQEGIHMEASWTPMYNSAYIEGIHNLYEFDCGDLSGWMYKVNGWYPNYGCSRYQLSDGDVVEWRFTCDFGNDIGGGYAIGG